MASKTVPCVRTLRLKVKRECYAWLNAAALAPKEIGCYCLACFGVVK